ncbi:NAD(P)-dependent oxidoreductase [Thorsellia anophelis]|uniref:Glyoxylate/hydroxypyruvate reductase A n=1 Tax=Thorsellia anophelis DSM 18579 TaxID=1123402 RepID=A0A1I0BAN4_9GAMM|nr:NAD(P)-dependent oxidoreductase [Thorsellia anophelis]SET03980.1 glyoxylate/hydroxypyruvate reductase A [Thorsellia anophelis DSM 18579]
MQIIFYHPTADFLRWQAALKAHLPHVVLHNYKQLPDNIVLDEIQYALVWAPPVEMLQQFKQLKGIFVLGAGVDALLSKAALDPDYLPESVPVMRIEDGGMSEQMIEYALSRVFHYFRRFDEYERLQRQGQWQPLESFEYETFNIGILGAGILGQAVATALVSHGFKVKLYSRTQKQFNSIDHFAGSEQLPAFLSGTKLLINLLPNTPKTQGMINSQLLSQLETGAYLINLARGAHVIEPDLLIMIESGQIAGASLDVFVKEPLECNHPFWRNDRIFITPHIAAVTKLDEAVSQIVNNIGAIEKNAPVTGLVNRQLGY